jgi:hypothetical protein
MFGIQGQPTSKFCTPNHSDPTKLRLKYTTPTIIPFLEGVFGSKYDFELIDQYIIVSIKETK